MVQRILNELVIIRKQFNLNKSKSKNNLRFA